jgi:hypothetical protein
MNIDFKIEKLRRDHVLEGFVCGNEPLNRFFARGVFSILRPRRAIHCISF